MDPSAWLPSRDPAVRVLGLRLGAYALSPDDALLAFCTEADRAALVCIEIATGREVFVAAGAHPLTALAWTSPEQLVVVRSSSAGASAELVAVPDGGIVARAALPGLADDDHRVTLSADGALACVVRAGEEAPEAAATLAVVLDTARLSVVRAVAARLFDEARAGVTRRARMTAALHPDGHLVAVATGRSRLSRDGARPGALWTLDLASPSPARIAELTALPPRELAWWSPTRVMVRAGNYEPDVAWNRVRGALHVVDVAARRVLFDALALPPERDPGVRSRWLEPWVHASPSPDGARMVLCAEGISRTTAAGSTLLGRVRVVDLDTGLSEEPVELDTRVAVAASAVFEGDGLVAATTRHHRSATLSWVAPGAAPRRSVTVTFPSQPPGGHAPSLNGMRLARSPAGRYLVLCGHERRERDALALHLALVDAAG